jgi:hypothetical protein
MKRGRGPEIITTPEDTTQVPLLLTSSGRRSRLTPISLVPCKGDSEGSDMSAWLDIPVMQALSKHSFASLGALLSFRLVGFVAESFISDAGLKDFLHVVEQFVLVGLVLYLVVRLGWHLISTEE